MQATGIEAVEYLQEAVNLRLTSGRLNRSWRKDLSKEVLRIPA